MVSLAVCLGYFGGKNKLFSCYIQLLFFPPLYVILIYGIFFSLLIAQTSYKHGCKKLAVFEGHRFHMCPDTLQMNYIMKLEISMSETTKLLLNTLKLYVLIYNICI